MKMQYRIKELRTSNNLTQKELAKKIQTTDKNIWAYENGGANPPIDVLVRIADLFDVSIDYLLGLEDDFGQRSEGGAFGRSAAADELTAEEWQLVKDYRTLSPGLKDMIKKTMDIYTKRTVIGVQ